jgi:hypothetical protein
MAEPRRPLDPARDRRPARALQHVVAARRPRGAAGHSEFKRAAAAIRFSQRPAAQQPENPHAGSSAAARRRPAGTPRPGGLRPTAPPPPHPPSRRSVRPAAPGAVAAGEPARGRRRQAGSELHEAASSSTGPGPAPGSTGTGRTGPSHGLGGAPPTERRRGDRRRPEVEEAEGGQAPQRAGQRRAALGVHLVLPAAPLLSEPAAPLRYRTGGREAWHLSAASAEGA